MPGWLSLVRPRKGNHSAGLIASMCERSGSRGFEKRKKRRPFETPAPGISDGFRLRDGNGIVAGRDA